MPIHTPPNPPKGYQMSASINVPADTKISADIEDRRDWGPIRNAVGKQQQDFLDYWRDVRKTYPDMHTAYKVIHDGLMNKGATPAPTPVQSAVVNTPQHPIRKVGEKKLFANGKTGVWDGHGWVAK